MRNFLFLFLLLPVFAKAQLGVAQTSFNTITDLRTIVGTSNVLVLLNGLNSIGDGNGGSYMWSATSTATDDGFATVQVTGTTTGRWMRMLNPNTIKDSATLSGTALQTAYPISFHQTLPAVPAMVILQAYSSNAAVPSWVTNVTTTGFTANFTSVPILGTNNIFVKVLIIKQ